MKGKLSLFLSFTMFLLLSGCFVPYPPFDLPDDPTRANIDKKAISQIIPLETSLIEVFLKLGQPDGYYSKWICYRQVYYFFQTSVDLEWWGDGRYRVDNVYRIYFDENWVVTKVEHERSWNELERELGCY